ncbi:MAG TPA: ATP-binding protein, partial [Chthoniobacterales bacterium]|nr:ATP-binding protein [Chthoniobacterales bacterium]
MWYAAATAVVLFAFAWFVYEVIEHRLGEEMEEQIQTRHALDEIIKVSTLGFPLAIALAAIGGYLIATRSLRPLDAMARQARRISSESLSKRLPNPNPHDELGRLATVFNETLARLEASFAELQRFTADASHELRSPLTALRAVGEVALRDGNDPVALRETIGSMLEEAQRLTDLVDALLTLARMDATQADAAREEVNIASLLEEVRDQFEILANEKHQTIIVTCPGGLTKQADRTLLRLALVNLVHNAIRHGPADSQIAITGMRSAHKIDISVKDNGPGIPREYHDKIFERFFRVDRARSRAHGGAGLGLAIVKQAVERNG